MAQQIPYDIHASVHEPGDCTHSSSINHAARKRMLSISPPVEFIEVVAINDKLVASAVRCWFLDCCMQRIIMSGNHETCQHTTACLSTADCSMSFRLCTGYSIPPQLRSRQSEAADKASRRALAPLLNYANRLHQQHSFSRPC